VIGGKTVLPAVIRSNVSERKAVGDRKQPVVAMKYRCVACCIVDIRLVQDHSDIQKLQQRPRVASELANCMDPDGSCSQKLAAVTIKSSLYDRLT